MSGPSFKRLTSAARRYADQLERINQLKPRRANLTTAQLRSLARMLADEVTAEQERRRRSRT